MYHAERILAKLNSPKGYGIRLQYLQVPMTVEEQQSFWSTVNYDLTRRIIRNKTTLFDIRQQLDVILERTNSLAQVPQPQSSLARPHETLHEIEEPTSQLSIGMLCWLNSIAAEGSGMPERHVGRLRSIHVSIGLGEQPNYVPPGPQEVPELLAAFVKWWRTEQLRLRASDDNCKISGLARFHHRFLSIHPFVDGNGRVARILLDQAARELFGQPLALQVTADPTAYFEALRLADAGEISHLERLIRMSLL
ncbi:MAG TPA: Fic family protein [Pirellulales bacterium]|nr:Fic family protein [Pirellulales bacterium]